MKIDMIKLADICPRLTDSSSVAADLDIVQAQKKLDNSRAARLLDQVIAKALRNIPNSGITKG